MSKISNTQKRFRQGRLSYKKMDALVKTYRQQEMVSDPVDNHEEQEHVHGEHCEH
jgi:hypothetical protein